MTDLNITVTGPVHIHWIDPQAILGPILARINALEATMTAPIMSIDEALTALQAEVAQLSTDETAERAAFDALATVVRAFIASVVAGGNLSEAQTAQAQAILDSVTTADAGAQTQTADETALSGEVPSTDAPAEPTA